MLCCRITAQEKGLYRLCHDGVEQAAQVSGKFQYEALGPSDYPTVGDEVLADLNGGGQAVIHKVLPRKSLFLRKAAGTAREEQPVAANVDILFLCMALNNDFNLRRLERYLAAAWNSGATPVVVLTKADLCGNPSEKVAAVEEAAPGTDVLLTSAAQEDGIRPLLPYLTPGRTVAFVGSSGVGKSTLMNGLLGKEILATGGLRNDDRGRHTTTRRQMPIWGAANPTPPDCARVWVISSSRQASLSSNLVTAWHFFSNTGSPFFTMVFNIISNLRFCLC